MPINLNKKWVLIYYDLKSKGWSDEEIENIYPGLKKLIKVDHSFDCKIFTIWLVITIASFLVGLIIFFTCTHTLQK